MMDDDDQNTLLDDLMEALAIASADGSTVDVEGFLQQDPKGWRIVISLNGTTYLSPWTYRRRRTAQRVAMDLRADVMTIARSMAETNE